MFRSHEESIEMFHPAEHHAGRKPIAVQRNTVRGTTATG